MKLLYIVSRFPYPLDKGDKLRAYHQIKYLSKKHEIILCTLNEKKLHPDAITELKKYCRHIEVINISPLQTLVNTLKAFFKNSPFQVEYFYNKKAQKRIDQLIKEQKPDHIFCQLIRTAEYVKNVSDIPKTLDYMDSLSLGMQRRKKISPAILKPIISLEYKKLYNYEKNIFKAFANKIVISEYDRDHINNPNNNEIHVVKNGVDTSYFQPKNSEKKYDLVFNGNMNYLPNIITAEYLVNKVLPLLKEKCGTVKLLLSGVNPSLRVRKLASKDVIVSGWVEDIRTSYYQSKIFIAPMQIGSGLQNKLLEAMAMSIPCITSALANNAIKAIPGKHLLIAETPEEYASEVTRILNDPVLYKDLAKAGRVFVEENFSWELMNEKLEKVMFS